MNNKKKNLKLDIQKERPKLYLFSFYKLLRAKYLCDNDDDLNVLLNAKKKKIVWKKAGNLIMSIKNVKQIKQVRNYIMFKKKKINKKVKWCCIYIWSDDIMYSSRDYV